LHPPQPLSQQLPQFPLPPQPQNQNTMIAMMIIVQMQLLPPQLFEQLPKLRPLQFI